ncbi:dual specificity protein kinase shkA-like [Corticium candelabrum]|uniref:dual specificity protein kinase shkA-like n=1 Tax=Corticium candelabrum TaxID=121492 RepID=UPI002E2573E8|nr:dual specificity protein kinase shkA-like [Corticium candelabrum]XP_062518848.1 dual specificity protein kinase shkA-like [Corticium candelabrum]
MFIVHIKMWQLVTSLPLTPSTFGLVAAQQLKSFYWKGFLLVYNYIDKKIKYLAVRCPAGFTSPNISDKPCNFCKKGYYRETEFADPDCIKCPNGLLTVNIGARKIEECTVCNVDQCIYGKCVADFTEEGLRPVCQCYVGFTGSTCQYPTYFLIGSGIILFVAVTSAGVTAYLLVLHRKKVSERDLRREVDVLTNAWQIHEDEVTAREILGTGASGSVYKAFYRNITVAVKKMVAVGLPKSIEDFETEIMFMRTVRHKNIVLFIGAGKSQPGDVPFLVMEYMERGSLKNVLYDLSIDIDYERKLSFAMDSARGMHFLHTLEPPRIHRDLKSDNLLVSKDWIVKVADFGLGRDVTGNVTRNGQKMRRRRPSDQEYISLLPKRNGLSYAGVGTERWRAPELSLREPYDTAVDVYSFGIVLWEIWTRELPFDQYRFDYQVSDAVLRKERPEIPRDCPQSLAMIMKNCWSPRPSDRLSFGQVISQLEYLDTI